MSKKKKAKKGNGEIKVSSTILYYLEKNDFFIKEDEDGTVTIGSKGNPGQEDEFELEEVKSLLALITKFLKLKKEAS